jgi:cell shape-determining protein MreC
MVWAAVRKKIPVMTGRHIHFSNASLFFSFLTAGLILLLLPQRVTSKISFLFYTTFEKVLRVGRDVQLDALRLHPGQEEAVSRSDYEKLWKSYKNLHAQQMVLHQNYESLSQLRTALPQLYSGLALAQVTGTAGSYSHEIIINQGSTASIRPSQYVLSEQTNCIIGIVEETSEQAATVRLLTDSGQSIEVRICREGTDKDIGAMMFGSSQGMCRISMVDRQQDVREGDTVYAAARPGILEVPIVIGEVVSVQPDELHPLLWDITVLPAEDMTRLDKVAVIVADETLLKRKE